MIFGIYTGYHMYGLIKIFVILIGLKHINDTLKNNMYKNEAVL